VPLDLTKSTRSKPFDYPSDHFTAHSKAEEILVDYEQATSFRNGLEHGPNVERNKGSQIDNLDGHTFFLQRNCR
jgi:hypothetical protein